VKHLNEALCYDNAIIMPSVVSTSGLFW